MRRYNVLQKLSYAGVVLVLLPLMALAGLAMSPGMNAVAPFLLDLWGGKGGYWEDHGDEWYAGM